MELRKSKASAGSHWDLQGICKASTQAAVGERCLTCGHPPRRLDISLTGSDSSGTRI